MKNLLIGAIILGFATLVYSQSSNPILNHEIMLDKGSTYAGNSNYLDKIIEGTVSRRVMDLQTTVANFNVLESPVYKDDTETYNVSYKNNNGKINATYNHQGRIMYSNGWFKDIILPIRVRNSISRIHPGWQVLGNTYEVSYSKKGEVREVYRLKIGNGQLHKRIRIDALGNLL